jgi:hypothetical protein
MQQTQKKIESVSQAGEEPSFHATNHKHMYNLH